MSATLLSQDGVSFAVGETVVLNYNGGSELDEIILTEAFEWK